MNYASFVNTLQEMLVVLDANGQSLLAQILPDLINDAELRCYRDLDLIDTVEAATSTCTPNSRNIALPTGMIVVHSANVITPASAASPDAGTRNSLQRVSLPFLDFTSTPAATSPAAGTVPLYFSRRDFVNCQLSFTPDAAYLVEFIGTIRPAPLSATNTTTILTTWFPDLFLDAAMVFGAGYQRDFGTQSTDPNMADHWRGEYEKKLAGADVEEQRKKAMGPAWTPLKPAPLATPPRA